MKYGQMTTYEQEKIILSNQYSKRVIIDTMYTRPYMPWEIDTEIKIPAKKQNANQTSGIKNKIGLFRHE